jgi:hypothetical protein
MHTNQEDRKREKHIQDNWNNNQKLAVASVLAAIVHLFPPSQLGIIPLIFSKWCSLLPVEETVSHSEVGEVHNSPCGSSVASENGKDKKPRDEDDEDVGCPHPGILEPGSVLIDVRRRYHLDIHSSDPSASIHHVPSTATCCFLRPRPLRHSPLVSSRTAATLGTHTQNYKGKEEKTHAQLGQQLGQEVGFRRTRSLFCFYFIRAAALRSSFSFPSLCGGFCNEV